jgi:hypothetical protein
MKRRKRSKRQSGYAMSKDLLNAMPNLVLGVSVAGMSPKLVP